MVMISFTPESFNSQLEFFISRGDFSNVVFSILKIVLKYNLISCDLFHLGNTTGFIGVFASCHRSRPKFPFRRLK